MLDFCTREKCYRTTLLFSQKKVFNGECSYKCKSSIRQLKRGLVTPAMIPWKKYKLIKGTS